MPKRKKEEEEDFEDQSETEEETGSSDEEEEEEEEPVIRKNPSRRSRKTTFAKVKINSDDEAGEGDDVFWNQGAWKETRAEEVFEDEPDSESSEDFTSCSEPEEGDEKEVKKTRRERKTKKNVYKDPRLQKKKKLIAPRAKRKRIHEPKIEPPRRASTRPSTQARSLEIAEKIKEREEMKSYHPVRKRKKVRKMSQQERLREAKTTEIRNRESLRRLLLIEDLNKKREVKKMKITGPYVRTISNKRTKGGFKFRFERCTPMSIGFPVPPSKAPKIRPNICPQTGRPARYVDPLTGQPYHDLNAFKALRKQRKLPLKPTA